jgi:hypothetical protein
MFQSFQHTLIDFRLNRGLLKNVAFSYIKSSLHDVPFPWGPFPWKVNRINELHFFNNVAQYNYTGWFNDRF